MTRYKKTIAIVLAWLAALVQAMVTSPGFQSSIADSNITKQEALMLLFVALGGAGVYQLKNLPPVGQPADPNISEASR